MLLHVYAVAREETPQQPATRIALLQETPGPPHSASALAITQSSRSLRGGDGSRDARAMIAAGRRRPGARGGRTHVHIMHRSRARVRASGAPACVAHAIAHARRSQLSTRPPSAGMSTAIAVSALLEALREPSASSLAMTSVVLVCTVATGLLLAFECGQYPCGKWYFRPRRGAAVF
jgi:hypothetical protein